MAYCRVISKAVIGPAFEMLTSTLRVLPKARLVSVMFCPYPRPLTESVGPSVGEFATADAVSGAWVRADGASQKMASVRTMRRLKLNRLLIAMEPPCL